MRLMVLQLLVAALSGVFPAVIAKVDDVALTAEQVDAAAGPKLKKLAAEEDRVRREVLQELIEEKLLAAEAKRREISVEQLLAAEVTVKTPAVTDDEVRKNVAELLAKRPDVKDAEAIVRAGLQRKLAAERRAAFLATLERAAGVRVLLEVPRIAVATEGRPSLGSASAPVTIVVFSDFQCPFCKDAADTLRDVQRLEGDRVRVVYRHLPLPIHPGAQRMAEAAECAASLGKFWPLHDALFANPKRDSEADLLALAATAGVDRGAFQRCLAEGAAKRAIDADVKAAMDIGVDGTPALFVNGRRVTGARSVDALRRLVAEEIGPRSSPPATATRKESR